MSALVYGQPFASSFRLYLEMNFIISQAEDAGVDKCFIKGAKAALKVEQPKAEARMLLSDALEESTIEALEAALTAAKEAMFQEDECREAKTLLNQLTKKTHEEVKVAFSTFQKDADPIYPG